MPKGTRNSSSRISPGVDTISAMVVDEFNFHRLLSIPLETKTPLAIDSDAVTTPQIPLELFKVIAWWNT